MVHPLYEIKSMKYDLEIIKSLWIEARDDLASAGDLMRTMRYSKVMYHCEQCMEKLMKIALACEGYEDVKSHEIVGLFGRYVVLKAPEEWQEKLEDISKPIRKIERQYPRFRYPFRTGGRVWIPSKEYKKEDAGNALETAKKTIDIIPEFVRDVYGVELGD